MTDLIHFYPGIDEEICVLLLENSRYFVLVSYIELNFCKVPQYRFKKMLRILNDFQGIKRI